MGTLLHAFGASNVGRLRRRNEDSFLCCPERGLFVVADGMGGHDDGDIASQTVVESFTTTFAEDGSLYRSIVAANRQLAEHNQGKHGQKRMGTTCTAIQIEHSVIRAVHVGDSRLYRLRNRELIQLTQDHTLVQEWVDEGRITRREAARHMLSHIISRSLNGEPVLVDQALFPEPRLEASSLPIEGGDQYLLCSDGLTAELEEEAIREILLTGDLNTVDAVSQLITLANNRGGRDNITVVLVRVVVE